MEQIGTTFTVFQSMLKCRSLFWSVILICIYSAPCFSADQSAVLINHGDYSVKTEILLPHLENNLHYTTTHTQQCLGKQDASTLFPILEHVSFSGCALVGNPADSKDEKFDLICSNTEAASGTAQFVIDKESFRGTLSVKMGGKNMKFSQRVYGRRIGDC